VLRIAASLLCVSFLAVQTLARDRAGCRVGGIAAFRGLNTSGAFAFRPYQGSSMDGCAVFSVSD